MINMINSPAYTPPPKLINMINSLAYTHPKPGIIATINTINYAS